MLQFEELRLKLKDMKKPIDDLADALGMPAMTKEIEALEQESAQPGFWDDLEKSQKVSQRTSLLKTRVGEYEKLLSSYDDAMALIDLGDEAEDESMIEECAEEVDSVAKEYDRLSLSTLLTGEYDDSNAILTFHAGAGGTEAMDWVSMLVRMYIKWGEAHNFKVSVADELEGEEAGIKSATLIVEGENAYGFLKSENGVHRLVRISPFDASGRRHTSFASLEVMPEIHDDMDIEIDPADIKMDVYRASGAGGQKVNKTSE